MDRTERQKLCMKRWLQSGGKGSVVACTGFGKTRLALDLADAFISKNPQAQLLVVVPTQVLKDQWITQIDERGLGLNICVEVINTVIKYDWTVDMLILDEAHRAAAQQMIQIFDKVQYSYILCLTGTMERLDMRHLLLSKYAPICDRITLEEAEKEGWVAIHKEYAVMLNVDLTEYNQWNSRFNKAFAFFNFQFDVAMKAATDYTVRSKIAKQLGVDVKMVSAMGMEFVRSLKARKEFIMNHPKKIEIARKIIEARKNHKIITFSGTIKQSEAIGIGWVMHSKKSKKLNAETIEQFNKAQCGVLNTSKAADEGVDIAGVDTEIILHTDSSKIRKGQRLGRAVRFEEGKVAEIFTLIIAGTQETKWLANSRTSKVITITEEQLDKVLAGEDIQTREREYTENIEFRF